MTETERLEALFRIQDMRTRDEDVMLAVRIVCERAGVDQLAELMETNPEAFDALVESLGDAAVLDLPHPGVAGDIKLEDGDGA